MTDTPQWPGFRPEDFVLPNMSAFSMAAPNFVQGQRVMVKWRNFGPSRAALTLRACTHP